MNWEAIAQAMIEWLIKHAPDIFLRMQSEVLPVKELLKDQSAAAAKLQLAQDLED